MLGKITKLLQSRKIEILVIIVFLLLSLRVITWFEHPNILISGDYRPQLNQEAFTNRVIYTWDQTDLGMPSVYTPKLLVPSHFFMTIFNMIGANTATSQMFALFLMMFLSSALMFIFSKKIVNGDILASFIAGAYFTANIYMINDREMTAITFLDTALVILPCIIFFAEGIIKKSYKHIAVSGFLFVLTYSTFPNYRNAIMCLSLILIILLFYFLKNKSETKRSKDKKIKEIFREIDTKTAKTILKYATVFFLSVFLASIWIIVILWNNLGAFAQTYGQMDIPLHYMSINIQDSLRLITKWGFYSGSMGTPYVPYANMYLHNPIVIVLSYIPIIIAFASLFFFKSKKLATGLFGIVALIFLILTSGFNPYLTELYVRLTKIIPLMLAFREPSQWSFFVIVAFSILIGITSSTIFNKIRRKILKILSISLVIGVLLGSSYPLTIGEVTRNPLNTEVKGSYFPSIYEEINDQLSSNYWTILIPKKSTYITYNFSGISLGAGNIYPLIFSKPIITELGTEYLQANTKLIENIYSKISEKTPNIATEANVTAKTSESMDKAPSYAIDQNMNTRWASQMGMPQWYELEWNQTQEVKGLEIFFEDALAHEYKIQTWNGTHWITQLKIENNTSPTKTHVFNVPVNTTKLLIEFNQATDFKLISIYEIEVHTTEKVTENNGIAKNLGIIGIKNLVVEKSIISGNIFDIEFLSLLNANNSAFEVMEDWEEATLYENKYACEKIYTSNSIKQYNNIDDMFNQTKNTPWTTLKHTAYIQNTENIKNNILNSLKTPQNITWKQINPTEYIISTKTNDPFVLCFLESYNTNWKAKINGNIIPEENHIQINGYANAWIIQQTGQLTITLEYTPQNTFTTAIIASITLPLLLITTLNIKQIKKTTKKTLKKIFKNQKTIFR